MKIFLFLCALCLYFSSSFATPLFLASFNVQTFGTSFVADPKQVKVLVDIIKRYDAIFIMEIRDSSDTAIHYIMDQVNGKTSTYKLSLSEREGRTVSKEQYALIYKPSRVTVVAASGYDDKADTFQRPPYQLQLQFDGFAFNIIGIHTEPDTAEEEIGALVGVYDSFAKTTSNKNALILGDFNAGCRYVSRTGMKRIPLYTDARFTWLIDYDTDTTTGHTGCAYDRFVTAGAVQSKFVAGSAKVFRFDTEFGLDAALTKLVSDHYPIEMKLNGGTANAEEGSEDSPKSSGFPTTVVVVSVVSVAAVMTVIVAAVVIRQRRQKQRLHQQEGVYFECPLESIDTTVEKAAPAGEYQRL